MSFPDDYFSLTLLLFGSLALIASWVDHFRSKRKVNEEDLLRKEVTAWIEALGIRFVAVRGSEWHWVVDPWNPPWTGTKMEAYYDEVFDTKRSGD